MKKIKVMTVLGTRPELIKLAPVVNRLQKKSSKFRSLVVLTGQHQKMVDQFLEIFRIVPDYNLKIMRPNQTLAGIAWRCLEKIDTVLQQESPDLLLVQGDTTTAFIAGVAAFYRRIPVGHVEAGLRTYDKWRPFPEELNRQMLSRLADLHFAPTVLAQQQLRREGIAGTSIFMVGNTVVDSLRNVSAGKHTFTDPALRALDFSGRRVILVTAHRRESFGEPFRQICTAIRRIAELPQTEIIYPVHLNPNVQKPVRAALGALKNVHLLKPLGYLDFAHTLKRCYLVLTDSGGVQEEAPSFGKPLLVMREVTERPEGVKSGVAKLVGMNADRIVKETGKLLNSPAAYTRMAKSHNPYGDGRAAERIVDIIAERFC